MVKRLLHPLFRLWTILRLVVVARRLRRSHGDAERLLAKQALTQLFAGARGITMKVGQLLVKPGEESELKRLVEGIEPLPFARMQPVLERELGCPWREVFAELDEHAIAASLGQVHHGRLRDGSEVAVKVRYPGIDHAIEAELRLAGLLPGVGPVRKWGFDMEGYRGALAANMARELDYRSEGERQTAYRNAVDVPGLCVPKVYPALSGKRVLVQSWEAGERIETAASWPTRDRLAVGKILLQTLFKSLFDVGELHADPNLGNYFFRLRDDQPEVVLLDFGSTISVARDRRLALLKLILALREGESEASPLDLFAVIGFDPAKLAHIDAGLPAASRVVFKPFLLDAPFNHRKWSINEDFERLFGEQRWWFRSAGIPDVLFLMRAFQGFIHQLDILDVRLPWWPLLQGVVDPSTLDAARNYQPPAVSARVVDEASRLKAVARRLNVAVAEAGVEKFTIDFPAEMALHLEEIIPETVLARVRASSEVDLDMIRQRVVTSRIAPQELFSLADGAHHYRVWLE